MITPPMEQMLLDAGFTSGWAIFQETLVIWEHEQDPPAPLTRPTDEIPNTDSTTDAD